MYVSCARAALLLVVAGVLSLYGQETVAAEGVTKADVVVVGTLYHSFRFPWFDGWNERGYIVVDRVLKGTVKVGTNLPFAWERDFRPGWCLTRPDWRAAIGKRGIWLLARDGDRYRAPGVFSGFNKMNTLQEILGVLSAEK